MAARLDWERAKHRPPHRPLGNLDMPTLSLTKIAEARIAARSFTVPSEATINRAQTPEGGWSVVQLAQWGVPPQSRFKQWRPWIAAIRDKLHTDVKHNYVFGEFRSNPKHSPKLPPK